MPYGGGTDWTTSHDANSRIAYYVYLSLFFNRLLQRVSSSGYAAPENQSLTSILQIVSQAFTTLITPPVNLDPCQICPVLSLNCARQEGKTSYAQMCVESSSKIRAVNCLLFQVFHQKWLLCLNIITPPLQTTHNEVSVNFNNSMLFVCFAQLLLSACLTEL